MPKSFPINSHTRDNSWAKFDYYSYIRSLVWKSVYIPKDASSKFARDKNDFVNVLSSSCSYARDGVNFSWGELNSCWYGLFLEVLKVLGGGALSPLPPHIDAEFLWRCSKFCVYGGGEQGSTLSYIMPGENSFRICNEPSVYTCDEKKEYIGKKHCSHLSNHGSNTDLTTVPDWINLGQIYSVNRST